MSTATRKPTFVRNDALVSERRCDAVDCEDRGFLCDTCEGHGTIEWCLGCDDRLRTCQEWASYSGLPEDGCALRARS